MVLIVVVLLCGGPKRGEKRERGRGRGRGAKGEMCWVEQTPLHRVRELGDPAKTSPLNWGDGDPVNTSPLSWER